MQKVSETRWLVQVKVASHDGNFVFQGERLSVPASLTRDQLADVLFYVKAKDHASAPRSARKKTYGQIADDIISRADPLIWIWSNMISKLPDAITKAKSKPDQGEKDAFEERTLSSAEVHKYASLSRRTPSQIVMAWADATNAAEEDFGKASASFGAKEIQYVTDYFYSLIGLQESAMRAKPKLTEFLSSSLSVEAFLEDVVSGQFSIPTVVSKDDEKDDEKKEDEKLAEYDVSKNGEVLPLPSSGGDSEEPDLPSGTPQTVEVPAPEIQKEAVKDIPRPVWGSADLFNAEAFLAWHEEQEKKGSAL